MNLRQFTIDFKEGLESIRKLAKKYTVAKKCCLWEKYAICSPATDVSGQSYQCCPSLYALI